MSARTLSGILVSILTLTLLSHTTPAIADTPNEDPDRTVLSSGGSDSWLSDVTRDLASREYELSLSKAGIQAPNRAHGLRTYFKEGRIEIVPRTTTRSDASWVFAWETVGWGRMDDLRAAGAATLCTEGARAEYAYDSGLVEWYMNRPDGIEQGFTIAARPEGKGELIVAGRYPEGIRAEAASDGSYIDFLNANDVSVLRYGGLHVEDADARTLPSRLVLDGNTIQIRVDDSNAVYPITIDPLMTTPTWMVESNQEQSYFAYSVSTAGDVNGDGYSDVIVGAHEYDDGETNEGVAFVYHGSGSGLPLTSSWTKGSDQSHAHFGCSVSTAGDVNDDGYDDIIVGAYWYDNGEWNEGGAMVYHGSASGLSPTPAWTAEGDLEHAWYGWSVSWAGDVNDDGYDDVIVGAYNYDISVNEGRAYVYHGSASGLSTTAAWIKDGTDSNGYFGYSVHTAGDANGDGYDDVIIGAPKYNDMGAAFVQYGSSTGIQTMPVWVEFDGQVDCRFGQTVSTAGDVNGDGYADILVGAPEWENDVLTPNEGKAYLYLGAASGVSTTPVSTWESNCTGGMLGYGLGTAGDVNADGYADIVMGTPGYNAPYPDGGMLEGYFGSPTGTGSSPDWVVESNAEDLGLGISIGTAGDINGDGYSDVIAGALGYTNGEWWEGAAFAYLGSADGLGSTPGWAAEGHYHNRGFGDALASAGDVNGDGFGDFIIGTPYRSNGGRANVWHGSFDGPSTDPNWMAESDQASAHFSWSLSGAGDLNHDGYDDVIVAAYRFDSGESEEGKVFVYHGSVSGLELFPAWSAEGDQDSCYFGWSVSGAGDVNGDGFHDVVIGTHEYDNGEDPEGLAVVYHGSISGLGSTPTWSGTPEGSEYGYSVSTAGDMNGDGYADLIVGVPLHGGGPGVHGRVLIHSGGPAGLSLLPTCQIRGDHNLSRFGNTVASAGDVNGDGYADVIVGAPGGIGFVDLFQGSEDGLDTIPAWQIMGDQTDEQLGTAISTAGDVNGDGYSDIIIGSPLHDGVTIESGEVYLFRGSSSGLESSPEWIQSGEMYYGWYGKTVSAAGDVDGNGYGDVLVGEDIYNSPGNYTGTVYLYYGNTHEPSRSPLRGSRSGGTGGAVYLPRQLQLTGEPISLGGMSDESGSFRLLAMGRPPAGSEQARLEWQVEELGTPLDGATIHHGDWQTEGTAGPDSSLIEFDELVSGLASNTPYHWRLRIGFDSPVQPHSHWVTLSPSVPSMMQLRTLAPITNVEMTEEETGAPAIVHLQPVRPNPFNPTAMILFEIPETGDVSLAVYDITGRLVRLLADRRFEAGSHTVLWHGNDSNGRKVGTGVYLVRLNTGDHEESRKMVLVK